ncbi:nucleoside deaminase [Clostridium cochlearium]|uniref:tRNA-specific adenosine deaminase n=1 Tax=Clostridium cochlearium TaxID=1494 RepID=A0ABY0QMZ8_CLOCO|nr:nucleoside deaminase [Clostridium cochlearium]MBV1820653.1 nucleoside deaminase [Bacteroidales bacterium MSK.15.36]NSJ92120.1 nucleoside deaminase [Coprococcus sp. MSK.21.13]MCG4572301.1 nucleoside deaminase [Clostridium cochlearium]NME96497.1 nucleoside deaminase [Clostridium cochlearium]SDL32047.1 tRNA(adenine34) deaminase [Clostridium cochlearium]
MIKYFMKEAVLEAKKALNVNEVPIGAIVVKGNKIIGRGYNLVETLNDPLAHAEIIAIEQACKKINNWRLNECHMYVTLEPCPMCAGAIVRSRISKVYIGTFDPNSGACGSVINLLQNDYLNTNIEVNWLYDKESSILLKEFFYNRR